MVPPKPSSDNKDLGAFWICPFSTERDGKETAVRELEVSSGSE